jgi:hypothetical protein
VKTFSILGLALAMIGSAPHAQKVGWSTGYYAAWAQGWNPPAYIVWKGYTHMIQFSITPRIDGTVDPGGMGLTDSKCKAFVEEAHKHGVKALICVGGEGSGNEFAGATATSSKRATLIKGIIAFMKKYGYDGVDMDWQELHLRNAQYLALHKELRAELDKIAPRPLLTVAVADYLAEPCASIVPYVDQMNAMAYWTPADSLDAFLKPLLDKGIPASKLGIGMGFDYQEDPDPEVDCDTAAVRKKCMYAIGNKFGGVMVWAIEKDAQKNAGHTPITETLSRYVDAAAAIRPLAPKPSARGKAFASESGAFDLRGVLVNPQRMGAGLYLAPLAYPALLIK